MKSTAVKSQYTKLYCTRVMPALHLCAGDIRLFSSIDGMLAWSPASLSSGVRPFGKTAILAPSILLYFRDDKILLALLPLDLGLSTILWEVGEREGSR